MNAYIYKFTLIPTGKFYVGQHTSDEFDENYYGSGVIWKKALSKYSKEDVKREILEWCIDKSREYVTERENYWITTLDALNPDIAYNVVNAVPNFWAGHSHTDETIEKISITSSNRRFIHKDDKCIGIDKNELDYYLSQGWNLGTGRHTIHSENSKKSISIKNKNKIRLTDGNTNIFINPEDKNFYMEQGFIPGITIDGIPRISKYMTNGVTTKKVNYSNQAQFISKGWVFGKLEDFSEDEIVNISNKVNEIKTLNLIERGKKISESKMGHKVSDETREKLRNKNLGHKMSEETRNKLSQKSKGRKHSEETKKKISDANKGRIVSEETKKKLSEAHLGSQSNHIWINNGNINRRVTCEDFKCIYEPQGFVLGRVRKDKKIHG